MVQSPTASETATKLCAHDRMQLFEHGEDLLSLTNANALADSLHSLREWLDVSEIVVAAGPVSSLSDARVVGAGYDRAWMDVYFHERFALVDPIVCAIINGQRFLNRAYATAHSAAIVRACPNGPTLGRFLEAAHDYGRIGFGFAGGVVYNGNMALCSVISGRGRRSQRAPTLMRALRPMLHQALLRVLLPGPAFPELSQRERTILECLASGQNDTQIADALAISESTVRFHLGNVFKKLGARNRCHAVAIGFQSGLLQR